MASHENIAAATPSYRQGEIVTELVAFSGRKSVSKASIFLVVSDSDRKDYFEATGGRIAFPALCFQRVSNPKEWGIHPTASPDSSSQGYLTNYGTYTGMGWDEVYALSPSVSYDMVLEAGNYDMWIRGFGVGTVWHTWNSAAMPAKAVMPSSMGWIHMGTIEVSEASVNTLTLYAGNVTPESIRLDQICLSKVENGDDLTLQTSAVQDSDGPFNLFVRARELLSGGVQPAVYGGVFGAWGWVPSSQVRTSRWYDIAIEGVFTDGLGLDYVVIGGRDGFHASWAGDLSDSSTTYRSSDYGRTSDTTPYLSTERTAIVVTDAAYVDATTANFTFSADVVAHQEALPDLKTASPLTYGFEVNDLNNSGPYPIDTITQVTSKTVQVTAGVPSDIIYYYIRENCLSVLPANPSAYYIPAQEGDVIGPSTP